MDKMPKFPEGKRYLSAASAGRLRYGERLQKVVIDAGFTCPNRDGSLGTGGCTFCSNAAFHPAYSNPAKSITDQIDEGIEFHAGRYRRANRYLAYFQSYSCTYAPLERLKELYGEALAHPLVAGIAVGTRPDCLDSDKLDYLAQLQADGKVVDLEIGVESCYDATLTRINRGHNFVAAQTAIREAAARGLDVCAHFILGLPGETRQMLEDSIDLINALPIKSLKFHQLQIIKGTAIEREFHEHPEDFLQWTLAGYIDFVIGLLERLRPDIEIDRIAGEVPPRFTDYHPWGLVRNFNVKQMMENRLEELVSWQGRYYIEP